MNEKGKLFSKILAVASKILGIISYIGIGCLVLTAILTPLIFKNIEIKNNKITIFSKELILEGTNKNIELYLDSQKVGEMTYEDYEEIFGILEKHSISYYMCAVEYTIIYGLMILIVLVKILSYAEKLFSSISIENNPFTKNNTNLIRNIGLYAIILVVIEYVFGLILTAIMNGFVDISFSINSVIIILIIYLLSYIFEYGETLKIK